ncbi:MAG: DegV family EDD domain-containing protein [Anaerolineales bacterium]|nr:DegV family EDD domain-containing protein [Anaerolineales bacterium]
MQIVTDSGTDVSLTPEQAAELNIHVVPLVVTLDGKSYREGVDIKPEDFYPILIESGNLPITSQPSAGEFADLYRSLAAKDPDILSIHMTSGLSGTFNSALAGAEMVPEANVTHIDTKTLSAAAGWVVKSAARAAKAGWAKDKILDLAQRIGDACDSIYTLDELKYLIHGGRISHMKGIIASLINIKPMIGVEKVNGTYEQLGQVRTFKGALKGLVKVMGRKHEPGSELRVQVLHSNNPEGAALLREQVDKIYKCNWLPTGPMSLVLGAHTGPSMVGVGYGAEKAFEEIP